jgi:spermidine synthase
MAAGENSSTGTTLARSPGVVLAAYAAAIFLSAALLFAVQPLFAKMVLPVLGGSPSVWAVALCFFQGALLAGYCYAHLLNRFVPSRLSGFVHLALCFLALLTLPIDLPAGWQEPPLHEPYFWQLGLFTIAIGLPFLAVAANAPLLQAWFAATPHPNRHDPYFLYAASNLGSLIALLAYPFVLEPAFGVSALSRIWTAGFAALMAAIAICFLALRRAAAAEAPVLAGETSEAAAAAAPGWSRRLGWVGLAFVPSALLTAFTVHVATDVASAPLLWVLPLSLYLLTFVLVFRERALIPMRVLLIAHLAAVIAALLQLAQTEYDGWLSSSLIGVGVFFTSAMVAHRTLYEARPPAQYLTEFYLWMSIGGVLGGLFAALLAPKLFPEVFEYPLLLALTMACRPRAVSALLENRDEPIRVWLILAAGILLLFWGPWAAERAGLEFGQWGVTPVLALAFAVALLAFFRQPARQLACAILMCAVVVTLPSAVKRGEAQRSYFGVYRVMPSSDGEFNILMHGTTLHGAQRVKDSEGALVVDTTPATYYHPKSPMARAVEIVRGRLEARGERGRYGVIGLGAGSLACYAKEGERWRFFEIDPVVVNIAKTPEHFSYLHYCQPQAEIVLGDARLTLSKEANGTFDLIIVDAFSSDAVPVHLMTAEALNLYASKLRPGGIAVLHISNRYLDLDTVVGATAALLPDLHGLLISDDESDGSYATSTSTVAVLSKNKEVLEPFRSVAQASELAGQGLRAWTDDHSDILGPLVSRLRQ